MSKAKTYRATADGFDGKKLRKAGDIFTTDIKPGSWMEEVSESKSDKKSDK